MTVPLGPKIYTDILVCEGCGQECTIWTDGKRAYAQCGSSFESLDAVREREKVTILCRWVNTKNDERCDTPVEFDLTEPAWVTVTPEILSMMTYAESIEVIR